MTNLKGYTLKFAVTVGAISPSFPSADVVKFFQVENEIIIAYELIDPKQYDSSHISFLDKTSNKRIVLHINDIVFVFANSDVAQNRYVGENDDDSQEAFEAKFRNANATQKLRAIRTAVAVMTDPSGVSTKERSAELMFSPNVKSVSEFYLKTLAYEVLSLAFEELYEGTGLA